MTDEEVKVTNSARRMTEIVAANDAVFRDNARAMSLTEALITDIAEIETTSAARISARGLKLDATADKSSAEAALDKFLRKMASTAKVIKKSDPAFDNKFKMRHGGYGSQELLDTARAFKNDLTTEAAAKFAEHGFASATTDNIQTKVDAFEEFRAQQNTGKGGGIAATAEVKAAIKRIRANRMSLKEVGENIIEETGDAGLLAEWKAACKLPKNNPDAPPTPPNP